MDTAQLSFTNEVDDCLTEGAVRGRWDGDLRTSTSQRLRACFAETPRAVIVDLADLADDAGASASTWRAAARYAATQQPASELILCSPPPAVRNRLRNSDAGRSVTVTDTVRAARELVRNPLWTRRRQLTLPAQYTSGSMGRTMTGDACLAWGLAPLAHPARLIVSELITNAVEHARTELMVAVSVRGGVLHLAVRDHHQALPRMIDASVYRPGELIEQRGTGLRLVQATATAWGAMPCAVGKVVWATITITPEGRTP
ncbi:MAG TPA: ATP-binding protein [Catenuloplanes sp.]